MNKYLLSFGMLTVFAALTFLACAQGEASEPKNEPFWYYGEVHVPRAQVTVIEDKHTGTRCYIASATSMSAQPKSIFCVPKGAK